jgi:outer membrane protein OmpA-like peptidoglycan-associated protein
MVTLLLTFFVMLLTLADVRDPELFNQGRDSFLESIKYIGLGALLGREEMPQLGHLKDKHFVDTPDDDPDRRTIDAEKEKLRRLFAKIRQTATVVPLQIGAKRTDFSVVNVHFAPGGAALTDSGRRFLTGFCRDLQQDISAESVELYVLGLAGDAENDRQQWVLSARRAEAVADFLREVLHSISVSPGRPAVSSGRSKWFVRSWGAGPGGDWVGRNSPISSKSHVLIGVIRSGQ